MSLIYTCINHILHRFVCMTVKCIVCMHLDKIDANNEQAMSYWFDPHNKNCTLLRLVVGVSPQHRKSAIIIPKSCDFYQEEMIHRSLEVDCPV